MQTSRKPSALQKLQHIVLSSAILLSALLPLWARADFDEFDVVNPPGQLVDVGGYRLHIYCEGEGTPTVVMDAGLGGSALEWLPVHGVIKNHTRSCVYDRAGYGWSDPDPLPRTSSRIADELSLLLQKAAIPGPYTLIGHSFGGYNVQLFARRHAHLTAGLVLVDSSHHEQVQRFQARPIGYNLLPENVGGLLIMSGRPVMPATMPQEAAIKAGLLLSRMQTRLTIANELIHFQASADEVRSAGSMPPVPLVVLTRGVSERLRDDDSTRAHLIEAVWRQLQHELAELSPRSIQVIAGQSGHHIHLDQPRLVSDAALRVVEIWRHGSPAAERQFAARG
ncbi:MAG: alpha/beta fold hydrolase [Chromatiales bacterium]